jgi:hypothetical protein
VQSNYTSIDNHRKAWISSKDYSSEKKRTRTPSQDIKNQIYKVLDQYPEFTNSEIRKYIKTSTGSTVYDNSIKKYRDEWMAEREQPRPVAEDIPEVPPISPQTVEPDVSANVKFLRQMIRLSQGITTCGSSQVVLDLLELCEELGGIEAARLAIQFLTQLQQLPK